MFPTRGTGPQLTGLALSHLSKSHASATPGNYIICSDYASYLSLQQIYHPSLLKCLLCRVKLEVLKRVGLCSRTYITVISVS
jgi:hypothetical protein